MQGEVSQDNLLETAKNTLSTTEYSEGENVNSDVIEASNETKIANTEPV